MGLIVSAAIAGSGWTATADGGLCPVAAAGPPPAAGPPLVPTFMGGALRASLGVCQLRGLLTGSIFGHNHRYGRGGGAGGGRRDLLVRWGKGACLHTARRSRVLLWYAPQGPGIPPRREAKRSRTVLQTWNAQLALANDARVLCGDGWSAAGRVLA